ADDVVDLIPTAAGSAGIARGAIVRDEQTPVRGKGQPEWIAQADRPHRVARPEWVVAGPGSIRVVTQDFAAQTRRPLRVGRDVVFPQRDVQFPVRAKGEPPALVTTVVAGRQVIDDGRQAGYAPALLGQPDHPLAALVVRATVERVHEMVALKCRT